jgi:hypothetical protein
MKLYFQVLNRVYQMVYLTPKIPIWVYLEGLGMETVGIFYGRLV